MRHTSLEVLAERRRQDQSHTEQNYLHLFGNIFGGHCVSRTIVGLNMFLHEFKDLDCLTQHAGAPVHPCSTTKDEECPGPYEFANRFARLPGLV